MNRPFLLIGSLTFLALLLAGGFVALHHYLSGADRRAHAQRYHQLQDIRDELLRYEDEHAALPPDLQTLTPAYIQTDDLVDDHGQPLFRFDPTTRRVAEANAYKIRGLWSYTEPPHEFTLPPIQTALRIPDPPPPPTAPPVTPLPPALPIATPPPTPPQNSPPPTDPALPVVPPTAPPVEPPPVAPPAQPTPPAPPVDVQQPAHPTPDPRLMVPADPGFEPPPANSLVFEAEHYSETNYGWEIHADPKAAGGAYLHCKEGIANGPAQAEYKAGNFYDVKGTREVTRLRYHFHLDKSGKYYIYGRMWTTDTHCSNNLSVAVDEGGPYTGGMENRTPFRWLWSPVRGTPKKLAAGDHYLHVFIHEDGIRVDQYILSPVPIEAEAPAYRANFATGKDTAFAAEKGPGVHLAYDLKSMVFSPQLPVDCNLTVRSIRPLTGKGRFQTVLLGAGPNGGPLPVSDIETDLAALPAVALLPLSFKDLEPDKLPRREYILQTNLVVDGQSVAQCRIPLLKPYAWEYFGPGGFLRSTTAGPLDGNGQPKAEDDRTWQPFSDKSFDHFGVLDFGVQFDNNMKHPRKEATVYAQTRLEVSKAGKYLLKIQADDQLILWLDGKEIFRHEEIMPVTRGIDRHELHLDAGVHTFRFRLNQYEGPWQTYFMVRSQDDDLCDVTSLPLEKVPAAE